MGPVTQECCLCPTQPETLHNVLNLNPNKVRSICVWDRPRVWNPNPIATWQNSVGLTQTRLEGNQRKLNILTTAEFTSSFSIILQQILTTFALNKPSGQVFSIVHHGKWVLCVLFSFWLYNLCSSELSHCFISIASILSHMQYVACTAELCPRTQTSNPEPHLSVMCMYLRNDVRIWLSPTWTFGFGQSCQALTND